MAIDEENAHAELADALRPGSDSASEESPVGQARLGRGVRNRNSAACPCGDCACQLRDRSSRCRHWRARPDPPRHPRPHRGVCRPGGRALPAPCAPQPDRRWIARARHRGYRRERHGAWRGQSLAPGGFQDRSDRGSSFSCSTFSATSLIPARAITAARSAGWKSSPWLGLGSSSMVAGNFRIGDAAIGQGQRIETQILGPVQHEKRRPRARRLSSAPAVSASRVRQERCAISKANWPRTSG